LDSEEAKALKWLSAPALKFSSGSNMREVPTTEDNDPIHTFQNGDVAEILNKNDNPWYEVLRTSDGVSGFVKFSSSRMEEITTINNRLMCLFGEEVGHVVQIEKAVKAGEVIGYVGQGITLEDNEIIKKPILHWSVFSQKTMGDFWTQIEDSDQNYTCNSERLIKLIDENCDKKLSCEEITRFFADEEKAKGMRSYACRFKSEWSVDWNSFREEVKKQGIRACTSKLELYNFWDDAVECDNNLPSDGHVWHYNPITFIERQLFATARATFLADCFEPDKTLPLPSKTCNLLSRIGQYVSANSAENIQIIAHSGVEGDTLDPLALSQARGDALKWIFTLDKNAIEGHLDENRWGNRERKIMLSYFNHYSGTINDDDENISDMVSSVKSFQEEHGLAVDGDAGPATFTKFFEVMLENAGISGLKHIEVVAAGENHPAKETVQNEPEQNTGNRVLEVLIWKSDIEPSVEQYAQEAQKTYDAWVGNIAHELSADQDSQILAGGDIFERDLFLYDAQNDTYLRIDNQYVGKFYEAVDECNSYVEQIEEVRENEIDEQAVGKIKKIKESFVEYLKKSRTLAKDANESGESTAMADPDAGIDTELKEFLAVNVVGEGKPKHKGWVYVRSDKVKDHWRKSSEKTLHNLFSEEEKDESGGLKDELKEKFKEKILDELKHEKVLWGDEDPKDILAPRFKFATGKLGEDSDRWDFSAGAQFLRFSAGASLKSEINLTNLEVNLEMAGSVTFAVAEAKVEGNWYIPDKKGIDVPKFLQDSERKITGLLNGASARPPTRTTFTPEQRSLYLRLKIGLSAKGFVGATASFAFPRLELKPVKGDDPDRERLAMATLEGEAFAGAQGQVKITGSADWCPECEGEEWKGMVTGEAGLAGTAGAGAEGRLHFGYRDGNIRFACSFQATFVVGGKAFWDFDLGLKEGLEFLCQMARCVDYHYVAEIAEDLYEAMGAYKFSLLITPQTGLLLGGLYLAKDLDEHVEKAKDFKDTSVKFFRMVDNFVDEKIQDHIFGASKNKLALLDSRIKTIKTSPPEAIARYLLIEMKTKEQDDFIYIPKVLEAIESDHEFRWVLRYVGLFKVLHNIHSRNPGASSIEYKGVVLQVKGNTIIASNKELRQIMEKMDPDGGDKVKNMMIKVGATRLLEFGDYYNRINYKKSYCDALIKLYQKNGVKL
ncbi:MAG: peptidoglycan-binding protein, partial [Chitinispirillaceae bacterium]